MSKEERRKSQPTLEVSQISIYTGPQIPLLSKGSSDNLASPSLVITRAPLRISFVGGGSDLSGGPGATISASIDKYVYCVAKWRQDSKVYLSWREKEIVGNSAQLKHDIVRECLLMLGIFNGIEILTFADVPGVGSGLGSSAATTIAVLLALYQLKGYESIEKIWLAERAADVELKRLKRSGGRQDQYISAIGGLLRMYYEDGQVRDVAEIPFPCARRRFLRDHFKLFAPRDPEEGRNSDEILDTFKDQDEFRLRCRRLVDNWVLCYEESDNYVMMSHILHRHHLLKVSNFPGGDAAKAYLSDKWLASLEALDAGWKLCGAGSTGHILVGGIPERLAEKAVKFEKVWGPELPFEFVDHGAEEVFRV